MTDSTRPMDESSDFHGQRTVFAPQQQTQQQTGQAGNPGEQGGTYEPDDSRTVTGASGSGVGSPGGSDQQAGGERWGGQSQGSQSQGDQSQGGQYGEQASGENLSADQQGQSETRHSGGSFSSDNETTSGSYSDALNTNEGSTQTETSTGSTGMGEIREHMEVIGADGVHVGTVDHVDGHRIKLTKADSGAQVEEGTGSHEGHHHYISLGLVAAVEGDTVRLSATAANAVALEEEE